MKKNKSTYFPKKNEKGAGLVELLLAVGIFAIGILTFSHMFLFSHDSAIYNINENEALDLAREGIEAVRSIRNNNFNDLSPGDYELEIDVNNNWKLETLIGEPSEINDRYKRTIEISNYETDENRKVVTSTVTWDEGEESVTLTEHLTAWQEELDIGLPITEGLVLHLDADAIEGLNDNDSVTQWNDLSGENNHAIQNTEDRQPTYKSSAFDGKPAVEIDGNNDSLQASLSVGSQYTAFAVVYPYTTSGTGDQDTYGFTIMATTSNYALWLLLHTGDVKHYPYTGSTGHYGESLNTGISDNEGVLVSVNAERNISNSANIWVDSTHELEHSPQDTAWSGSFSIGDLRDNRQICFDGLIAEVLVYDTILSVSDREAVEQYLGNKWGITLE